MKNIFQIIDNDGNRLSVRQTRLRKNYLKLKYSNNKKTYWKLKDGYLKNIYFHKFLGIDKDNKLLLTDKKLAKWSLHNGAIKHKNLFISHSLNLSNKPYYWHIKCLDYTDSTCLTYIGYGLCGFILASLIIYSIYCKNCSPLVLLYIYIILIIVLLQLL